MGGTGGRPPNIWRKYYKSVKKYHKSWEMSTYLNTYPIVIAFHANIAPMHEMTKKKV